MKQKEKEKKKKRKKERKNLIEKLQRDKIKIRINKKFLLGEKMEKIWQKFQDEKTNDNFQILVRPF